MNSALAPLPFYFSKGPLKLDFLETYLTTYFGIRQFKSTSAMRVIYFLKMFKIESKLRKCKKKKEKSGYIFGFWENGISKRSNKFPLVRREYMSLAVNGLTKSPKIMHIIKRNFFQLNCIDRNQSKSSFEQYFCPFTMSLFEVSSERGFFRHLPNHVFRSP